MAGAPRAIDNDSLVETSFRRLLAAIESEREKIRSTWQQIEQDRENTTAELGQLRSMTQEWCTTENTKIQAEWGRLNKISDRMALLWPEKTEVIEINCSNEMFTTQRAVLCSIPGSRLAKMFSDEYIGRLPRDFHNRIYLDFNPHCFRYVMEYLQNRRLREDAPTPVIAAEQQQSMDLLAEALQLKPFLRVNKVSSVHSTSLQVFGNTITAMHPGWQLVSAAYPLSMAGASFLEIHIMENPDSRGGLALGVCGHIPSGSEVHSIGLKDSIMYNSNNGLIGDCIGDEDVQKELELIKGMSFGILHNVTQRSLTFYVDREPVGSVAIRRDCLDRMRTLYPVFAMYVPEQKIKVDFDVPLNPDGSLRPPEGSG